MESDKLKPRNITVKDLREQLQAFSDDDELYFGGLIFDRLKSRGNNLVQMEFSQTVYQDTQGNVVVENH